MPPDDDVCVMCCSVNVPMAACVCVCMRAYVGLPVCMYARMHSCMRLRVWMCTCVCVCIMYVCVYVCVCVNVIVAPVFGPACLPA